MCFFFSHPQTKALWNQCKQHMDRISLTTPEVQQNCNLKPRGAPPVEQAVLTLAFCVDWKLTRLGWLFQSGTISFRSKRKPRATFSADWVTSVECVCVRESVFTGSAALSLSFFLANRLHLIGAHVYAVMARWCLGSFHALFFHVPVVRAEQSKLVSQLSDSQLTQFGTHLKLAAGKTTMLIATVPGECVLWWSHTSKQGTNEKDFDSVSHHWTRKDRRSGTSLTGALHAGLNGACDVLGKLRTGKWNLQNQRKKNLQWDNSSWDKEGAQWHTGGLGSVNGAST